jgi:hypothetical protein
VSGNKSAGNIPPGKLFFLGGLSLGIFLGVIFPGALFPGGFIF